MQFSLDKTIPKEYLALPQSCNGSKLLLKIIDNIYDGFKNLFEKTILKFYIYMEHKIRFMNQHTSIKYVMVKMNNDSSVCVAVTYFRMK